MRLRRIGWAGVEIDHDGHTLLIDFIEQTPPSLPPIFTNGEPVRPLRPAAATAALVTHLHADHADPDALAAALAATAPVFRPEPNPGSGDDLIMTAYADARFREAGLRCEVVRPWEGRTEGPFRITAAPSVDGFGDPQLCWVVEAGGKRVLHAGDTLFHGYWWAIARAVGPIDVAFLPVNGVVVESFHLPTSPFHAVMLPEEAAVAAQILRARVGVPIHHGTAQKLPGYRETPRPAERFAEKAKELGVTPLIAGRGEWFTPE